MRVAALSDIHGNIAALDAVLAEIETADVDAIVCCGDVVGGPFSVEAFERLTALPGVRIVRGNADRFAIEGEPREVGRDWPEESHRLGEARLAEIASWPLTVELDVDGLGRTLFCHAVPSDDMPVITRVTPDEIAAELMAGVAANLVVCGHTHVQFDRRLSNGLRIVNAGSVGMPYEGRQGAYWTILGPGVEHRRTEYDVDTAAVAIRDAGGESNEQHAGYLFEPPDPDETSAYFESLRGA